VVFAGNHGVVGQGISAFPQAVTAQMVANFQAGGAAVNQLCQAFGVGLKVYELALEQPTRDITVDAAMEEADCAATMVYGMEAVAEGPDLLCIGEMGIGNTTIAAAIAHALHGGRAEDWVGPGTGLDAGGVAHKADVVRRAIERHAGHLDDPLEVLRRLGGREIAAMCGAILAARLARVPVLIDGYVATAAAAILHAADTGALDHCMAAHRSAEPAHGALLDRLAKRPILDLGMRWGKPRARCWRRPPSWRRPACTPAWRRSPPPASAARRGDLFSANLRDARCLAPQDEALSAAEDVQSC
jgi:nicotinate-nucleotide--dimethylbenzimidazole phosphoribosyltransferase